MNLTASQRVAIENRGSNLLVAASAGSGKTEVLARRCVSLIADPRKPCGIDRLLVVTFTRAAAAELRVRIVRMLGEEAERSADAGLRRHLRRQELLVETADIGTIDAWCGRVVREHFAEAGVDVEFSVLGEQDATLLRRSVLDELFDGIHRGGEPLASEARAWIARSPTPGGEFLRGLIERLNVFREHLVNPDRWFERQRAACAADDAESVLVAALADECGFQNEQLTAVLTGARSEGGTRVLQPYCDRLATWQQRLATPGELTAVVADIKAFKITKPGKGEPAENPEASEVRDRWLGKRLQKRWSPDVVASILQHAPATAELVSTLLRLEERYQSMLAEAKLARAAYEFGDVLRMSLDLLGRPTEGRQRTPTVIARRLQQRYEHILVDEYQDTSPVQVEILRLVTRDEPGCTNRFMVGDVKQSIYGFRQAEPRLFAELIEGFEAGRAEGRVQYLADNFRSHAGVLEALNPLFALLFDRALGGTRFGQDERLTARREELANPTLADRPRVEVHVIEQDQRRGQAAEEEDPEEVGVERIEREAQLAAEHIRALLRDGVEVPRQREDGRLVLRPLRLADVVVLLRSAKHSAGLVARVFRINGIRCMTSGRESLLDTLEVRDVCNVLELLVNRRQDVALAAYLRGPLVGLTPAELLQIGAAASEECCRDFYDAVEHYRRGGRDIALVEKLQKARAQLEAWFTAAREEELPALLQHILHDGGLTLFARALPGGEQRVALLQSLQNLAGEFAAGGPGGVAEFVEYLDALTEEEIDPGALAAGGEDVVRIMTIHAAKGLEFPVVFLLGAGAKFNEQSQHQPLQCHEQLGLGLKFNDYPARAGLLSARHHVVRQHVRRRELEEELRLLYVAATRARERLLVVGHTAPGAWSDCCAQYAEHAGPPPLISRLSVSNRLEWVLMATAAGRLHESAAAQPPIVHLVVHNPEDIRVAEAAWSDETVSEPVVASTSDDDAWVERGRMLLEAPVDRRLAVLPAVLSVSALKELATRERTEDMPHVLDATIQPLRVPAFAAEGAGPDGRELGTACHRFLEVADFARLTSLDDVQTQVAEMVAAGRLSAAQGALVPVGDVAWLGASAEGALLREYADRARREVPFVYAMPLDRAGAYTIVRGVIDCLLQTPEGLVILDYKTDAIRDEQDFAARVAGYKVQLQLYAEAASRIFAQPAVRAVLVFVRARRVLDVPPAAPSAGELLGIVDGGGPACARMEANAAARDDSATSP